jgi:hypothetical protein
MAFRMPGDLLQNRCHRPPRPPTVAVRRQGMVEHDPGQVVGPCFAAGSDVMRSETLRTPALQLGETHRRLQTSRDVAQGGLRPSRRLHLHDDQVSQIIRMKVVADLEPATAEAVCTNGLSGQARRAASSRLSVPTALVSKSSNGMAAARSCEGWAAV